MLIFYQNFQFSYKGRKSRKSLNAIFFFSFRFGAYSLKFTIFALHYTPLLFFLLSFRENWKFSFFHILPKYRDHQKNWKFETIFFSFLPWFGEKWFFFVNFHFFLNFNFPRKTKNSKFFAFFASIFYKKNHFFLRFRAKVKKKMIFKKIVFFCFLPGFGRGGY